MKGEKKSGTRLLKEIEKLSSQLSNLKKNPVKNKKQQNIFQLNPCLCNSLCKQVPHAFWILNTDLRFVSYCDENNIISRYKYKSVLGKTLKYIFKKDKFASSLIEVHKKALRGKASGMEILWEQALLYVNVEPLKDEQGKIIAILGNAHDITEARKDEQEREAIHDLSQRLIAPLTLAELAKILCEESRRLFNHDAFAFFLYYLDRKQLFTVLAEDTPTGKKKPVVVERGIAKDLSESRIRKLVKNPKLINRVKLPQKTRFSPFGYKTRLSRSFMIVPIYWENQMIGSIGVTSYKPNQYSKRDLEILTSLTNLCAGAVARVRTEQSLKDKEKAIQTSINAMAFVELNGKVSYVNHSFLTMWDYDNEQNVLKKPFIRFWKDKKLAQILVKKVLKQGWWMGEMTALRQDKTSFEAGVSATLVKDERNKPKIIMISVVDISSRILADKALQIARFSLDKAVDAIFWIDPSGRFIYVNDSACRILGYSPDELLELHVHDVEPHFKGEQWRKAWRRLKKEKKQFFETLLIRKDKTTFPVEISACYLKMPHREFKCSFVRDITKRKEAEHQLKRAHEIYRKVIRNDGGVPYVRDVIKGTYEFFYENKPELAGISLKNITVQGFTDLVKEVFITDPDASKDPEEFVKAFQKGEDRKSVV